MTPKEETQLALEVYRYWLRFVKRGQDDTYPGWLQHDGNAMKALPKWRRKLAWIVAWFKQQIRRVL